MPDLKPSQKLKPKSTEFNFSKFFKFFKGKNPEEQLSLLESVGSNLKPYQKDKVMSAVSLRKTG